MWLPWEHVLMISFEDSVIGLRVVFFGERALGTQKNAYLCIRWLWVEKWYSGETAHGARPNGALSLHQLL